MSQNLLCTCGHTRDQHDMEQPYECFGETAVDESCECRGFTYDQIELPGAPLQPGAAQPERDGVAHAPENLFTHSELTTLLERMARLVVEAAIRLAREEDEELRLNHISALLAPEKLQQLREAVERP